MPQAQPLPSQVDPSQPDVLAIPGNDEGSSLGESNPSAGWSMTATFAQDDANWFFLELADRAYEVEKTHEYKIPAAAIHHTDPGATIKFVASKSDDTPLPHWISFNAKDRAFLITPPVGAPEEMVLKVKAIDEWGNETEAFFTIKILEEEELRRAGQTKELQGSETTQVTPQDSDEHVVREPQSAGEEVLQGAKTDGVPPPVVTGKLSFSAQLAAAGRQGIIDESAQLLSALQSK